jgi:hypothetical protein
MMIFDSFLMGALNRNLTRNVKFYSVEFPSNCCYDELMLIVRFLVVVFASFALATSLFSQLPAASLGGVPSQNKALYTADLIRDDIRKEKYSVAIDHIQELLSELKQVRQQQLSAFFPKSVGEYRMASSAQSQGYFSNYGDEFGVIWSRHYVGKSDRKIDINLVFQDPSIKEYAATVSNPVIVNALPNTKLIILDGGFKALQKYTEEDQFYEVNIVLSKEILINVLTVGITSSQDLKNLLNSIDLQSIKQFLEK